MTGSSKEKVAKDKVVSIHYTLHDDHKVLLDSSVGADPLMYLHGRGQLIKGLESELTGKAAGEKFSAVIACEDGYGAYEEDLKFPVPRAQFPKDSKVEVGTIFEVASAKGSSMLVRVAQMEVDSVVVDANHPLAGKTLHFDVEVVEVREATESELAHGHAHGPGGAHDH